MAAVAVAAHPQDDLSVRGGPLRFSLNAHMVDLSLFHLFPGNTYFIEAEYAAVRSAYAFEQMLMIAGARLVGEK